MATEKRLIDANALKANFSILGEFAKDLWHAATILSVIDNAPTVDAVEVVHGHWREWWPPAHMILTGEEMLYRCSACDAKYADVSGYKFCPNCGARMDGDGNA